MPGDDYRHAFRNYFNSNAGPIKERRALLWLPQRRRGDKTDGAGRQNRCGRRHAEVDQVSRIPDYVLICLNADKELKPRTYTNRVIVSCQFGVQIVWAGE